MDSERFREGMELRRPYRRGLRILGGVIAILGTGIVLAPLRGWRSHTEHHGHRPLLPLVLTGLAVVAVSVILITTWWRLAGRDAARNSDRVPGPYDY